MENEKVNIDPSQMANYPAPEIPVTEAWQDMSRRLDTDLPVVDKVDTAKKRRNKYLLSLLLFLAGSIVYYKVYYSAPSSTEGEKKAISKSTNSAFKSENNIPVSQSVDKNNSGKIINESTNSPVPPDNITAKRAVADAKEKQQADHAIVTNPALKMKNTGTLTIKSGTANNLTALVNHKAPLTSKTGSGRQENAVLNKSGNFQVKDQKTTVASGNSVLPVPSADTTLEKSTAEASEEPMNDDAETITDAAKITEESTSPQEEDQITRQELNQGVNSAPVFVTDALQNSEEKKTSKAIKQLGLSYGLQWNAGLPLQGTKNYFSGTNGSSQPYIALIPDLWVSKQVGPKMDLLLMVHLTNLYATGEKPLASAKGAYSPSDTTTVTRSVSLLKTSGFSAGLQYDYHFYKRWSFGAGLNYHTLNRALVKEKTTAFYTGALLSEYTTVAQKNGSNWLYLNASFFTGKLELSYQWRKIKTGASLYVPISDLSSVPGNRIRPVNGQLFLRWRLGK